MKYSQSMACPHSPRRTSPGMWGYPPWRQRDVFSLSMLVTAPSLHHHCTITAPSLQCDLYAEQQGKPVPNADTVQAATDKKRRRLQEMILSLTAEQADQIWFKGV